MVTEPVNIPIRATGGRAAANSLKQIGSAAKTATKSLSLMRNLLVVVAAARVAKRFLDMADSFVVMQNRLKLVTTSMTNLIDVQEKLFAVSQETGTSFESNVNLFARMARATDRLGLSQKTLIDVTRGINQALVLSGATAQEARNGLVQFSQGLASGTLRGDELRSVVEQFPELARIIGKEFGVAGGELAAFAKKNDGILKTDRIIKAIREALPDLAARFAETNDTIGRGFERVNNSMIQFIGKLGQATGATKGLINVLNALAKNFDKIVTTVVILGAGLSVLFTGSFLKLVVTSGGALKRFAFFMGRVAKSFFVTQNVLARLLPRLALLGGAFATILTGGIFAAIAALIIFRNEIFLGNETLSTLGDGFNTVVEELKPLFTELKGLFSEVGKAIADAFGSNSFQDLFVGFLKRTLNAVLGLIKGFRALVAGIRAVVAIAIGDTKTATEQFVKSKKLLGEVLRPNQLEDNLDKVTERRIQKQQEQGDEEIENIFQGPKKKKQSSLDDGAKEAEKFAKKLKSLQESMNPVLKANNELSEGVGILDKAFGKGLITAEQFEKGMFRLMETTREARMPLQAFNDALEKELMQSKLSTAEREIAIAQEKALLDLKEKGADLTTTQIADTRELVRLTIEQTERNIRLNTISEGFKQPAKDLAEFRDVMAELIEMTPQFEGQIRRVEAALRATSLEANDNFADSMEAAFLRVSNNAAITGKKMSDVMVGAFGKAEEAIIDFVDTGKFNLDDLFKFIRREIIKIAIQKAIIGALAGSLAGAFSGGAATGGTAIPTGNGGVSGDLAGGFALGGSFGVGGAGGTDSQLVSFMATPGEQVSVQTPQQQRDQGLPFSARGLNNDLQGIAGESGVGGGAPTTFQEALDAIGGLGGIGGFFGGGGGGSGGSSGGFLVSGIIEQIIGQLQAQQNDSEKKMKGFARGGSFRVGGSGGTDSQNVAFRATPGENVTVTPGGGGNGDVRPIQVTFNIQTPDANSFIQSQGQISAEFSRTMSRHSRRNN